MRRPLAVFGFAFLLCMLAAVRLPAAVLWPAAGVLAAAFAACMLWGRRIGGGLLALLLAAAALALGLRAGHMALRLNPLRQLEGSEHTALVRVQETEPGYGGDTVHASLKVLELDGAAPPAQLKVKVRGLPAAQVGQLLRLPLRFYAFGTSGQQALNYGRGYYLGASAAGAPQPMGYSHTLLTRLRQLQYAAGNNITARLPLRLGSVAAAMTVGDRRQLSYETTDAYRAGGISHMLVVSGLHISLLCSLVGAVTGRLLRRRPRLAGAVSIGFVLLFMFFTGLTVSVVRAGVVWLLMFCAPLLGRRADILTSMGLAALLLVAQNPYTAADVGLLLSFAATLGAVGSGLLAARLRQRGFAPGAKRGWPLGVLLRGAWGAALTSACVTLATLPVLVYAGMGLSLLSLPVNLIAVPLLTPIILCGLLMALPALPLLGLLAQPTTLICGVLLRFLEVVTGFCQRAGWAYVPLGGLFGLTVVLAVYALALAAVKTRRRQRLAFALCAAVILPLAFGLHTALDTGTVRATVAGSGPGASLVVTGGGQSVVLYRSRLSMGAVQRVLRQNRAGDCALFVDLRRTAESTEYEALNPREIITARDDLLGGGVYTPIEGVTVYLARQGGGTAACVEVEGYKVGICTGAVNLQSYAPLNALVAGSGEVQGQYDLLLCGATVPDWADPEEKILQNDGDATLWIRPGKSVVLRDVADALD